MYDELPDALDVADGEVDVLPAPGADEVSPDVTDAFDSMNDGPNAAFARVERVLPVVDVDPVAPLPLVPTVAV